MGTEKRTDGNGIYIPLSPEEKEQVLKAITETAPDMAAGKFARTALFFYLHMIDKHGAHSVISEILGA